jgi:hypothetical protein
MNTETKLLFEPPEIKPDSRKALGPGFEKNFDRPLAHRGDPLSSFEAADRALKSGRLQGQMRFVLIGVRRWPGRTSAELAELLGCSRYDTARRLPALEHRGLVRKDRSRLCAACKSVCVTWITTEYGKYPLIAEKN